MDERPPDWVPDRVPEEWEIEGPAVLAALTEQAVGDPAWLSDEQLMGALSAARRLENRAAYLQAVTIAEFVRRRAAQAEEAAARRSRPGTRSGDFPDAELSIELLITQADAAHQLNDAASLTTRLPATLAGLAAGSIDYGRAATIVFYTDSLGDADAARSDEILAAAAPGLRPDQLAREASGNASIAGRELPTADVMASKSYLDAVAARLREAGLDGTLDHLRAPAPAPGAAAPDAPDSDASRSNDSVPNTGVPDDPEAGTSASPAASASPDSSDSQAAPARAANAPAPGPRTPPYLRAVPRDYQPGRARSRHAEP